MTEPVLLAFGLAPGQATVLRDELGAGGALPAPGDGLLAVVEDDATLLDPTALPPLADGRARRRLVTAGHLGDELAGAGWSVVAVRTVDEQLVALAHGPATTPWPALVAHLEAERAAAIARAELVDGILMTLGGQYAVEHAARATAAEALAGAAAAELVQERVVREHLEAAAAAQAAEIARLVQETFTLKQRLVGPDGAVSPRVAQLLAQARRARRVARRRLAARR